MKLRVYSKILNLIKHLHLLSDDNLSHEILNEQIDNDWPGLSGDAKVISEKLAIEGLTDNTINKVQQKTT